MVKFFVEEEKELDPIAIGAEVEKEHESTYNKIKEYLDFEGKLPDPEMVYAWIAEDHIKEFPTYYDALKEMETKLEVEANAVEK